MYAFSMTTLLQSLAQAAIRYIGPYCWASVVREIHVFESRIHSSGDLYYMMTVRKVLVPSC